MTLQEELANCDKAIKEIRSGKYGNSGLGNALGEADWEAEKYLIEEEIKRTNDTGTT